MIDTQRKLKIWKTIKVGTGLTSGRALCSLLGRHNFGISYPAEEMLKCRKLGWLKFPVATVEEEIDLVPLFVADLGFTEKVRYGSICAKALEIGLQLCPAEVGPQLRLQYPDQPRGEWLVVAMKTICGSVFNVKHNDWGRRLTSSKSGPARPWFPGRKFVFRLPRKHPLPV